MLISFEELPGAGKSTQAALLATCLTQQELPAVTLPDLATLDTEPVAATLIDLFERKIRSWWPARCPKHTP